MLDLEGGDRARSTWLARRGFLRAGFLGLGGLTLADLARLRAAGGARRTDTAVLLLFVHGGPSHLETYDLKPAAPEEVRGPFRPIRTNVPGIEVCEHLPRHARVAHRFTLVRSCCHDEADHFAGHRRFLSGYGKLKTGTSYESHHPQVGAVVNRLRQGARRGVPAALAVGGVVVNGPDYAAGISEGYLGGVYRVPIVNGGLRDASLRVDPRTLGDRLGLRRRFDGLRRALDARGALEAADAGSRQALELLTAGVVQRAFDLAREPLRVRERYGEGWGQEVLTALRLAEAGVSFVTVRAPGGGPGSKAHDWDDHAVNWDLRTAMLARLPRYDQVVSALVEDLYDRGLDRRVLLVVTGEFGRTPRLERKEGRIGRDHWPGAMSMLVSGGGMRTGQVVGSTTGHGEQPRERALDPHDVLATVYRHLGINPQLSVADPTGRPMPLCRGEPIRELAGSA